MDDILDSLTNAVSNSIDTTGTFGQGLIASAITGNPLYSNDPAAVNYAKSTTALQSQGNTLFLIFIAFVAWRLLK